MTNGLIKERNIIFIDEYVVQWFSTILQKTKVMIYAKVENTRYVLMSEMTLGYVACERTVRMIAKTKILEIERYN